MNGHSLTGVFSALVTPFREDASINWDVVPGLVGFQMDQGIDGFYVGGSTGEAFVQTEHERAAFIRAVANAAGDRATLIAHIGSISTAETIRLGEVAAEAGYHAISAIPPFYYDFSRDELMAHYLRIAGAIDLPLIIYNFAGRNGRLTTNDILQLLDHPRIAGVKHTSQDLYQLERFKRLRPESIIYNGYDEMCLAGFGMGADGAIGTTFNFMGRIFVDMRALFLRGNADGALQLQKRANAVIDELIDIGVFPATKAILKLLGYDCGECRPPFRKLLPEHRTRLEGIVEIIKT